MVQSKWLMFAMFVVVMVPLVSVAMVSHSAKRLTDAVNVVEMEQPVLTKSAIMDLVPAVQLRKIAFGANLLEPVPQL